jgi:hypothetical protein
MSQNDFTIANQTFPNTRADINSALQALTSNNSGTSAPSTQFANQFWYNSSTNILYIRNEGNDADIPIMELDQTNDTVEYFKADSVRTTLIEYSDGDDALTIADGGALTTAGNLSIGGSNNELRFYEGANYVGFEAPALSADKIWVLPTADGTSGQALVTNGSGTLSFADASGGTARPNKSPIMYNGNMAISQRATVATGLGGSDGVYPSLDRWRHSITAAGGSGRFTSQRVAVTDNAPFATAINFDCTTADTSISAGEEVAVEMRFEGQDLQYFEKGYSTAKSFTVAFWCKAQDVKTYAVELYDDDNNRHVSKLFTTATSWTRHVIDFGADTTGKFDNNNALSMRLKIWLHAGSNFTGGTLATTWASFVAANRAAGIGSFYDNTDNSLSITGIQLEVGSFTTSTIPDFQHETYGENLARCERYCQSTYSQGTNIGTATNAGQLIAVTAGTCTGCFAHGVTLRTVMRAVPTIVVYKSSGTSTGVARRGNDAGDQALAAGSASTSSVSFENSGSTADQIQLQWQFSATAEL